LWNRQEEQQHIQIKLEDVNAKRKLFEIEEVRKELESLEKELACLEEKEEYRETFEEQTWFRCLNITDKLLENTTSFSTDPRIMGLLDAIILPGLKKLKSYNSQLWG
jgi:hypothetical protein